MMFLPPFVLPVDDFESKLSPLLLSEKIVVVSAIGKSNWSNRDNCSRGIDEIFQIPWTHFQTNEPRAPCRIEGNYCELERVLYLTLIGPWDVSHLNDVWRKLNQDMEEMGFLHCWNLHTNVYARALLFVFTMSHIVVIDHPSHTPDFPILQLLKQLSYVRPKYQSWQTSLLTRVLNSKDEWFFNGRLCSPRLLFAFPCPPDIEAEEDEPEKFRRANRVARAIEDRIYMTLRKSKIVKLICNKAFYSIAPNDEFVHVEVNHSKTRLSTFEKIMTNYHPPEESDSDGDDTYFPFSTEKKGMTFAEFLKKHINKAHNEGFYDNMGKYTHVKPFFQKPTLGTWLAAANAIFHDPNIGLENEFSVFPNIENVKSPETHSTSRSQVTAPVAMAIHQSARFPRFRGSGAGIKD